MRRCLDANNCYIGRDTSRGTGEIRICDSLLKIEHIRGQAVAGILNTAIASSFDTAFMTYLFIVASPFVVIVLYTPPEAAIFCRFHTCFYDSLIFQTDSYSTHLYVKSLEGSGVQLNYLQMVTLREHRSPLPDDDEQDDGASVEP